MEENSNSRFIFLATLTLLCIVEVAHSGTLSFCDGPTHMEKTREQCGAGLTFGENKPDCICVSGM